MFRYNKLKEMFDQYDYPLVMGREASDILLCIKDICDKQPSFRTDDSLIPNESAYQLVTHLFATHGTNLSRQLLEEFLPKKYFPDTRQALRLLSQVGLLNLASFQAIDSCHLGKLELSQAFLWLHQQQQLRYAHFVILTGVFNAINLIDALKKLLDANQLTMEALTCYKRCTTTQVSPSVIIDLFLKYGSELTYCILSCHDQICGYRVAIKLPRMAWFDEEIKKHKGNEAFWLVVDSLSKRNLLTHERIIEINSRPKKFDDIQTIIMLLDKHHCLTATRVDIIIRSQTIITASITPGFTQGLNRIVALIGWMFSYNTSTPGLTIEILISTMQRILKLYLFDIIALSHRMIYPLTYRRLMEFPLNTNNVDRNIDFFAAVITVLNRPNLDEAQQANAIGDLYRVVQRSESSVTQLGLFSATAATTNETPTNEPRHQL